MHVIADVGYAFLPRWEPRQNTLGVAVSIGKVVLLPGLEDVQVLRPRKRESSPPNIYSGNFGVGDFPLHTDLAHWYRPPRYFILRCITGSAQVSTRLFDARRAIEGIGPNLLRRALFKPRRQIEGVKPLLPLYEASAGISSFFRWDELFIEPASRAGARARLEMLTFLSGIAPTSIVLQNPGDTLIIDNWRMLHGRSAVPESESARRIERVYLAD
jgi:hypothetical protein